MFHGCSQSTPTGVGCLQLVDGVLAVEVDDTRRGTHGASAEQDVEREVALEVVEQKPQEPLGAEAWIRLHEGLARIAAAAVEEIRNRLTGGEPMLERGVNAAGGDR